MTWPEKMQRLYEKAFFQDFVPLAYELDTLLMDHNGDFEKAVSKLYDRYRERDS